MIEATPLPSYELRWFFEGRVDDHPKLKKWFEQTPFFGVPPVCPVWAPRSDNEPDRYLLVPGATDIGIKWRENCFQVKGRLNDLGLQRLPRGHAGYLEHWLKWSYAEMPPAYKQLFSTAGGLQVAVVNKIRALRLFKLDTMSGSARELAPSQHLDRGLGFELTDVEVNGQQWCTLGIEAFPDDAAMPGHLLTIVGTMLGTLEGQSLRDESSLSYPAFLDSLRQE